MSKPMPIYELVYFHSRGEGEPLRWFLAANDVDFTNTKVPYGTPIWEHEKALKQYQKPPVLLVEGTLGITHATVIARYLSRQLGLVPSDAYMEYRLEQVIDIIEDCRIMTRPLVMECVVPLSCAKTDKDREAFRLFVAQIIGRYIEQLRVLLSETEGDFFLGEQMTFADIALAHLVDVWENSMKLSFMGKHEEFFMKHKEKVMSNPKIKAWIAANPAKIV